LTNRTKSVRPLAIAMPYGSSSIGSPTTLVNGSCAASPARIVSSVETASIWFCCNITRQSVQSDTWTGIGRDGACAMLVSEVEPSVAHTRLPPSSSMPSIPDASFTSTFWPAR
jgi:hypothetical protein